MRWTALCALGALGMVVVPGFDQPALRADDPVAYDTDRDGLPNAQELALGTSPLLPDTDFDGFGDALEVALGSSPYNYGDVPAAPGAVSVGVTARGEGGMLHLLFAIHAEDGNLADKTLDLAMYSQGRWGAVALHRLLPCSEVSVVDVPDGSKVMTLDVSLPPSSVELLGAVTWVAMAGVQGNPAPISAAKADLTWKDGLILWRRSGHLLPPSFNFSASFSSSSAPTGSVHDPIPPGGDDDVPTSWEPGQVCIQRSAIVGSNGPLIVKEVVYAECQSGWNSYCDPGCPGTVGERFDSVDPKALIGG